MRERWTIIDNTNPLDPSSTVIDEPVGWDSTNLIFRRHKTWHGFIDFWDDAFNNVQWHGKAAEILRNAYAVNGLDARVEVLIEYACDDSDDFEEVYTGKFTFERYSDVCGDMCYVECGIEAADCLMTFKNRYDQKVNLDSLKPFDNCCEVVTVGVGGGFIADSHTILITSVDGHTPEDLTGLQPGDVIEITGTASNDGLYTVVSVFLGESSTTIIVEEDLVDGIDGDFSIEGCLFDLELQAYAGLNKTVEIPSKVIQQTSTYINPSTEHIADISHLPGLSGGCDKLISQLGDVVWSPVLEVTSTEINTTHAGGKIACKTSGGAPENFPSLYDGNDGYLRFKELTELKCGYPIVNIKVDIEATMHSDSPNSKNYDFGVFLFIHHADGTTNRIILFDFVFVPNHSGAATLDFSIHDTQTLSIEPEDTLHLAFYWANIQYTTGDGDGDTFVDDPMEMWLDWSQFKMEVVAASECEPTEARVYLVNEALSRCAEAYTCDCLRVKSDYFGRWDSKPYTQDTDGCGSLEAITNGLKIRANNGQIQIGSNAVTPEYFVSMKELFDGLNAIHNIGMGIEPDTGRGGDYNWLRIEPRKYFYDNTVILSCGSIREVRREVNPDAVFSLIKIGYQKWETENVNGLNDVFGNREYRTKLKALSNTYDRLCQFIASDYAIEVTRRQYGNTTKDWRYDNNTFIICLTNRFCATTQFLMPHGILVMGTDDLTRWNTGDQIVITGSASNDGTYTVNTITAAGGNTLLTVLESITTEEDAQACYVNNTHPFRIVQQDIVASSSNLLFPEYCLNLPITPVRNLLRHFNVLLQTYRNWLTEEFKFTAGTGNYIASIELDIVDCLIESAGQLAENANVGLNNIGITPDYQPIHWPELVTFTYPLSWTGYKALRNNPYGLIEYQCGNGPMEYGWIQEIRYKAAEGLAEFTLLPKIEI